MDTMSIPAGPSASSTYWYEDADPALALLRAVRRFRQADRDMRRTMGAEMDLNATDVEALRHVVAHGEAGHPVTARELSAYLHISTASTSKLLNRLSGSGHIRRVPHPRDRRSVIVEATAHAHAELRGHLSPMHQRMLEAARAVPESSRQDVIDFLDALAGCLDPGTPDDPDTPAAPLAREAPEE
jgi:DNA-binding MarR family transcriptional regulator